ncbi:hypothetical protein ALC56_03326 [Trachymyrmex septentrionalis]|uniref:Uncharacterized protein n=1 Tax=Trachymyrmex septentrionalis TaxID=34720 RepID=A0A195FP08_9HYME|nr:hypothetical protein ALC56_03326 [Trachymyrmex septentrionalis]
MRVTSTNGLHHLGAALLNSTIHLGIVNRGCRREESWREKPCNTRVTRPKKICPRCTE